MGQNKRYFWLKLFEDFFSSKRIKKLRTLAGGDTYTIIYLKMQLKALKTDGYLYFDGVMNDFADELALDIDENAENVKVTIQYLLSVGLIECSESGEEYYLSYMQNVIGSETASTQRSRDYRQRQKDEKALQCSTSATELQQPCSVEIEKDIELDKDKEKDIELDKNKKIYKQKEIDDFFDSVWKLYIRKKGKTGVTKKAKEEIYKLGFEKISACIDKYAKECQGTDPQYILYGSTFFNGRYKDYLDDEAETKKEPKNKLPDRYADYE